MHIDADELLTKLTVFVAIIKIKLIYCITAFAEHNFSEKGRRIFYFILNVEQMFTWAQVWPD